MTQTEDDVAELTLHHMGRTGFQPALVVIGAMDGVSFDGLHPYIVTYEWSGLFVEPMPAQFRRLWRNYVALPFARANKYENSAIANHDGTVRMLTIDQRAVDEGLVHPAFGGMSAIYPPRNGLASEGDAATVQQYGQVVDVNCITLDTLFTRHAVERVDVLWIDAEGWDYEIVGQLDFSRFRPKLLRAEYINLSAGEKLALTELVARNGYVVRIHGQNIDAVAVEYWNEIAAARPKTSVHAAPAS